MITKEQNKSYKKAWRETHREECKAYQKAWREAHKAYQKAWHEAHREERKAYQKAWRETHREEYNAYQKAWRETHREQNKAYNKAWYETHREEYKAYQNSYQKAYYKSDLNSLGQTKSSIRIKSQRYLKKMNLKIPGNEIHHCFTYDDPSKFIYCSREIHLKIHNFLRDNNIDADSDHYEQIKHLLDEKVIIFK